MVLVGLGVAGIGYVLGPRDDSALGMTVLYRPVLTPSGARSIEAP
jgi:hypothetical protein